MSNFSTLSEFLLDAGTQYHIFDLGRGIREIDTQQFLDIEQNKRPYPFPRQGAAWIGVIYWNKQFSTQHYIWFIKLPIDERGLLQQASRNHFISIIIEALGTSLEEGNDKNDIPEHPYHFEPNWQQMASFNAISRQCIGQFTDQHYSLMQSYVATPSVIDWQTLSIQSIADYCAWLSTSHAPDVFIKHFKTLHPQVIQTLCACIENHALSPALTDLLLDWCSTHKDNAHNLALGLRALAQAPMSDPLHAMIHSVIENTKDESVLTIIAARHWLFLRDINALTLFLERCLSVSQTLFEGLYLDLVRLPDIRASILTLAHAELSDALKDGFEQLAKSTKRA